MHYYGPISYPKIIRTVYANIYNDPKLNTGYITRINTANTYGLFKSDDTVYQGDNINTATAFGIVIKHSPELNKLVIGATQGSFKVNNYIHAASTNAVCQIASFNAEATKLAEIRIRPDPIDAQPEDDYGYDVTLTEWPDTEA